MEQSVGERSNSAGLTWTTPQVLMIDADDTLWENNIYFEQAINHFVDLFEHPELTSVELRAAFDRFEADRVRTHGYGVDAFHNSLLASFQHFTGASCDGHQSVQIARCVAAVRNADITLLEGVAETLPLLAARHRLILVTKGSHAEQTAKLARSGLRQHFHHVEVLREKHAEAYRSLLQRHACDPTRTWMIGNSPRSDINAALSAGLNAIHLPHPSTWALEEQPLRTPPAGRTLLRFASFRELLPHFT